jgi:hypothetical protein
VIAAIVVLLPAPSYLLLDNIAVSRAHQGQGLGWRLLAFAEAKALRRGYHEIRLYTHPTMVENRRLSSIGYDAAPRPAMTACSCASCFAVRDRRENQAAFLDSSRIGSLSKSAAGAPRRSPLFRVEDGTIDAVLRAMLC